MTIFSSMFVEISCGEKQASREMSESEMQIDEIHLHRIVHSSQVGQGF